MTTGRINQVATVRNSGRRRTGRQRLRSVQCSRITEDRGPSTPPRLPAERGTTEAVVCLGPIYRSPSGFPFRERNTQDVRALNGSNRCRHIAPGCSLFVTSCRCPLNRTCLVGRRVSAGRHRQPAFSREDKGRSAARLLLLYPRSLLRFQEMPKYIGQRRTNIGVYGIRT